MSNVRNAIDLMSKLGYSGPVGIGTDDTSIEKALQAYLSGDGSWLVVGGCDEPILARSPQTTDNSETLDIKVLDILHDKNVVHADKARVIILTIPVPKVSVSVKYWNNPCSTLSR